MKTQKPVSAWKMSLLFLLFVVLSIPASLFAEGIAYVGEIRMLPYVFPPEGWQPCDGKSLPVAENQELFAVIGNTYGGDGDRTFKIPDLRGRTPIHPNDQIPLGGSGGADFAQVTNPQEGTVSMTHDTSGTSLLRCIPKTLPLKYFICTAGVFPQRWTKPIPGVVETSRKLLSAAKTNGLGIPPKASLKGSAVPSKSVKPQKLSAQILADPAIQPTTRPEIILFQADGDSGRASLSKAFLKLVETHRKDFIFSIFRLPGSQALADSLEVTKTPTVIWRKNDRELHRLEGSVSESDLERFTRELK